MEPSSIPPSVLLWLPVAIATFLLPGWILSRRLTSPLPIYTAFIGSAAFLFLLTLLLDATGLPIQPGTLGIGLALISAALLWRYPKGASLLPDRPADSLPRGRELLWLIPPVFAFTSVALRAVLDPLSGFDNSFRWDYLARLVLARESLAGYPPVTAGDFERYGWCDGIPPLVALLNHWIYAAAGSIAPVLTAPRVIGEALLLGLLVHRYSRLLWGPAAGGIALAALASSALALWSVAMGQETGLTALGLVGMLYFLELHAREHRRSHVCWAAVAASIGALSRDYGLAFPVLGLVLISIRKETRSDALHFITVSALIAAPWYLRNWAITGNPVYPMRLGGLFPGNSIHDETMRYIAEYWSLSSSPLPLGFIPRFLAALAGVLGLVGVIGAWRGGRRSLVALAGIALMTVLWLWSIGYTGGGRVYSARVLSPALALLAVLAGGVCTFPPFIRMAWALLFIGTAADAARRSWLLPEHSFAPVMSYSFDAWRNSQAVAYSHHAARFWETMLPVAAGRGIVTDHPLHHTLIASRGGRAIPLFSPLLAPTFHPTAALMPTLHYLRSERIKFVCLYLPHSITTEKIVANHPFWSEFSRTFRPNLQVGGFWFFDLEALLPLEAPAVPPQSAHTP